MAYLLLFFIIHHQKIIAAAFYLCLFASCLNLPAFTAIHAYTRTTFLATSLKACRHDYTSTPQSVTTLHMQPFVTYTHSLTILHIQTFTRSLFSTYTNNHSFIQYYSSLTYASIHSFPHSLFSSLTHYSTNLRSITRHITDAPLTDKHHTPASQPAKTHCSIRQVITCCIYILLHKLCFVLKHNLKCFGSG